MLTKTKQPEIYRYWTSRGHGISLYALDTELTLPARKTKADVLRDC